MRFASYRSADPPLERVGVVREERIYPLSPGTTLCGLLSADAEALVSAGEEALRRPEGELAVADVTLLSPVPAPPSVRDFLAFEEHVRNARNEVDSDWYELPVFYFSNPAAVQGPYEDVAMSPGSTMFDYELEVAAVVGPEGANLTPEEAIDHIAGYTILCDFSARDLQRREMRMGLGPAKGKDGATPLGPWLVTPDELEPYRSERSFALEMTASVNGVVYGGGSLGDIYWSFAELLSYASRGTRVMPGDVLGSGTVGTGCILEHAAGGRSSEFPWLEPGDVVELRVEHLGTQRHRILPAPALHPLRPH